MSQVHEIDGIIHYCANCRYCAENCRLTDRCAECMADYQEIGVKTGYRKKRGSFGIAKPSYGMIMGEKIIKKREKNKLG